MAGGWLEFGLLGPLVVDTGDSRVMITAGKQRVLLAALLLRANQVVPADDLTAAVWDRRPPPTARVTLQNYVKRLRRALGPGGYQRIVTLPAGYLVKVGSGELDLARFGELAGAGRAAAAAGDWQAASERLTAALALWRGRPLADVSSTVLAAQVPRLAAMRLDAAEARIEADLHLGRHREVIPELRALAAAEPLRERLHELLMLALYRSGQQAEALAAYRDARRHLVQKTGLEPGPALRELNERLLRADPGLLPASSGAAGGAPAGAATGVTAGAAPAAGSAPAPRMLPGGVAGFTGRSRELRALSAAASGTGAAPGSPVVITAIGGTAGVGKTALAVHWARQHAAEFPAGQLYVNLRGFGPGEPLPAAEALRVFLDALRVPAGQVPAGQDARQALYRRTMAGQRALVVLDNARDQDQVRPLLPGTPTAVVLVTSRSELASLAVTDGARQVSLDVLPLPEARQLLARRLGSRRLAAEPRHADELIELCARLPLAVAITAARAAAHPAFPLAALAADLRDVRGRLDVLRTGEDEATDVRAVFSWSYRALDPAAARMFRLLGLHPGPDITAHAAASLAALSLSEARRLLRELARGRLLAEPTPGRYAFHDLLRAYAAEQAAATDPEAGRREAVARVLDHYLHTAHSAEVLMNPSREPVALPPPRPGVIPERMAGHRQARDWFESEHGVLLAAAALADRAGFDVHAWQLPSVISIYLNAHGLWHEEDALQRSALTAATRAGDLAGQAAARRLLAYARVRLGDHAQALAYLAECPALYRQLGDRAGEGRVHESIGWVHDQRGRHAEALGHAERALGLYQAIGYRAGQARALNAVGWNHAALGDHRQARVFCRESLVLHRELGNRIGEADTWDSLGYAAYHLGEHAEAAACYGRALSLSRELGDRVFEAEMLTRLGDAQHAGGDPGSAGEAWRQALAILEDMRSPGAAGVRGRLRSLDDASASRPPDRRGPGLARPGPRRPRQGS